MPGPGVPASECLRGIPATADPHAPRAAPLAASPALRPLPRPPPIFTAIISTRELSPGRETSGQATPPIAHWYAYYSPAPRAPHCANGAPPGRDPWPLRPLRGFAPRAPSFGSAETRRQSAGRREGAGAERRGRIAGKVWLSHKRVQKISRQRDS